MSFIHLKDAEPEEIVAEALDLNELQQEIYAVLRDRELTVQDLVEETGRTRSVVQRALQEMHDKAIVVREGRTEKTVYYVYTAVPFERLKPKVAEIIDDWYEEVQAKLQ